MPKIVICGSLVYKNEILYFSKRLRELGLQYVVDPKFENVDDELMEIYDEKERMRLYPLYKLHLPELVLNYANKIRRADLVYFYNKNQRMGINTTVELGIAIGLEKTIVFYEEDKSEPCRQCFCDFIIKTPEDLVRLVSK